MKRFIQYVAVLFLAASSPSFPKGVPVLSRLPYLQKMTSHSVLIAWRTNSEMIGAVLIRPTSTQSGDKKTIQEKIAGKDHALEISNLQDGTWYQYEILDASEHLPLTSWIKFQTFPANGNAHFTFGVLGDSGNGSEYQKKVAHQLFLYHPLLVIHTGDVIYDGKTDADYDSKFFSIYGTLAKTTPFFPSLGNHDAGWNQGLPYLRNFYFPQSAGGNGKYYSFSCGQSHFVALDSNESTSKGSPEYVWLVRDLSKDTHPIKIIYFHHPLYSSGYHGSTEALRETLQPVFNRFHIILVFNGHDHDYERTMPVHGITYIVSGGGGGALYPVASSRWTAFSATVHHFIFCTVDGKKISIKAIDDTGKVFDQDTISAK